MLDLNKHKFFLVQILKDIYIDIELANCLGFKGGTALMLLYDLPRFSVDLDFNLLEREKQDITYKKIKTILGKYGRIKDEAKKRFGLLVVLDYGEKERNLKVEISNRIFNDRYEIKNFLGINIKTMLLADMFAHKLCALLDRNTVTNRDIFDCWYFMQNRTPVNKDIVESRTNLEFEAYISNCINTIEAVNEKKILDGIGELTDKEWKPFIRLKLKKETISLLRLYKEFPIYDKKI